MAPVMVAIAQMQRLPATNPFGHLSSFRNDRLAFLDSLRGTDVRSVRLGWIDATLISSPELAQEVLVERAADYRKSRGLALFAKPLIGDGILASHGEIHRRRRSIVAPAFQPKRLAGYADAIAEETQSALGRFEVGSTVDISTRSLELTLAIVARTLFGTNVEGDIATIDEAMTDALRAMIKLVSSPLPLPPTLPTRHGRVMVKSARKLRKIVERIVTERRASGPTGGNDVLSLLLSAKDEVTGEQLTDREIYDEAITLFLAGHETTANALAWAWHLVARNPAVETRLRAEARAVLGDRLPTMSDLPSLPYALCVLKESMRLYPPAYFIGRRALVDTTVAGFEVAKGRTVFINVWGLHRDARLFPDPEAFRPERFLDGAEKTWIKGSYMPFGGGPRICVGNHFALMEGQMILAQTAARFGLSVPAGTPMPMAEPLITLRLATPCDMIVGR